MYKINADVKDGEKDWTKILDGYEIIFMEITDVDRIEDIPADCDTTMKFCMKKFLNPRERKVLYLHYFGGLSYRDIAKRIDVSAGRCQQIKEKAFRKLRNPSSRKILWYGMSYYNKVLELRKIDSEIRTSEKIQEIEEQIINAIDNNDINRLNDFKHQIEKIMQSKHVEGNIRYYDLDTPFINLDLSVRAYNCLKRAGYKTVGDLEGKTYSDLMRIRNLGITTLKEIVEACSKYGINIINDYQ